MASCMLESNHKHVDQQLQDENVKYEDKISILASGWRLLIEQKGDLKFQEHAALLIRHSVLLILRGDWKNLAPAVKTHLKRQVQDCSQKYKVKDVILESKCQSIISLTENPWGHPTLISILHSSDYEDSAALEFLESDRYIFRTRLSALCESRESCEDLAQKLTSVVWTFYKRDSELLSFFVKDDLDYILDLCLVLYAKRNKESYQDDIIAQVRNLPIQQGLLVINRLKRYHKYPPDKNKVWKKCLKAAEVVVQLFAAKAIKEPSDNCDSNLNACITEFVQMFSADGEFKDMVTTLGAQAFSISRLHALASCLNKLPVEYRLLCIELCIKALTTEVNQIHHFRTLENDVELRAAEEHLSLGFLQLADLLLENLAECRECVLTAFSLNPTSDCLDRVREMAIRSGKFKKEVIDTGQTNVDTTLEINPSGSLEVKQEDLSDPAHLKLELPQNLLDDLHVILKCPRNRDLNWQLDWPDLNQRCYEHLEMLKGERPSSKKLQYLDLDYEKYMNMPSNEDENHDGIEKGYELSQDTETDEDRSSPAEETGSDVSYTNRSKKSRTSELIDPRRKKIRTQKAPKRNYLSSDDSRNKFNVNVNLLSKKAKSQRKPKGKTPKSDSKRNGKSSSFVQFQVSNCKEPRDVTTGRVVSNAPFPGALPTTPNYCNVNPDVLTLAPPWTVDQRKPPNIDTIKLRTFRHNKKAVSLPGSRDVFGERQACGYRGLPVPGLDSLDMLVPLPQSTTVQVVHLPGSAPHNVSSTIAKPEDHQDGAQAGAQGSAVVSTTAPAPSTSTSTEVNGKPTPGGATSSAPSAAQATATHVAQLNSAPVLAAPKTIESYYGGAQGAQGVGRLQLVTASGGAVPLAAPGLAPLTTRAPRRPALTAGNTTALPQFHHTFGAGPSALKQALLATTDKVSKLNSPAAGLGAQTQPAGFVAPVHPPGLGSQQPTAPPVPPLQARLSTTLSGTSLQPHPLRASPQPEVASLSLTLPLTQGLLAVGTQPPPTPPTCSAATAVATTAQVIVKSGSGAMATSLSHQPSATLTATPTSTPTATATGLVQATDTTSTVSLQPLAIPSTTTSSSSSISSSSGTTATGLQVAPSTRCHSVVTVAASKSSRRAVTATDVGQGAPPRLPTLVHRTPSFAAARGAQLVHPVKVAVVSAGSVPMPALVQTGAHGAPNLSVVAAASNAAEVLARRLLPVHATNPILGKFRRQEAAAAAASATTTQSSTPRGAAAAAAAATAAAKAEAANAPTNVQRPLYAPAPAPGENDLLKAQLREFDEVLYQVHSTRQQQERQSLEGESPTGTCPDAVVQVSPSAATHAPAQAQLQPKGTQAVADTTVSTSFTQTAPLTPKKKAKSKAVVTATVPAPVAAPPVPVPAAIVIPAASIAAPVSAPALAPALAAATTTTVAVLPAQPALQPDQRVFKPGIIHGLPSAKHPINQKITEDEETTARILSILRQYDEQLRCSPEINNKPAPRRRNQAPAGSGSGSGGSGSGSSPTAKRKSKKSKGSGGEMSPGTDDTHTMGSEDSSIASHFADGVMEATPTSPLSTCDDRSVASGVTTSGETASVVSSATTTTVTSFAGLTKAAPVAADFSTEATGAEADGPKAQTSSSPLKVQCLAKAPTPPKVSQLAPKLHGMSKPQILNKVLTPPKVTTPHKVQVINRVATTQRPTMIKVQTFHSKAKPQPKGLSIPKIHLLPAEVVVQPASSAIVSVPPALKDGQTGIVSQTSRVIQTVETVKLSQAPEAEPSAAQVVQPPPQAGDEGPATPSTGPSQVSQLESALQSKQVAQTPLLARALKSPAVPLPTTFTGILNTTRSSVTQPLPVSQTQTMPISKLADVMTASRQKVQSSVVSTASASLNVHAMNLKAAENILKTTAAIQGVQTVQQVITPVPVQALSEPTVFNRSSECAPPTSLTVISQPVQATPIVMLPTVQQSSKESPPKAPVTCSAVESSSEKERVLQDIQSNAHDPPRNAIMTVLSSELTKTVSTSTEATSNLLTSPHIVQLVPLQPTSQSYLAESSLRIQETSKALPIGVVQQTVSEQSAKPISADQMITSSLQMHQPLHLVQSVTGDQLTCQVSQPADSKQMTQSSVSAQPNAQMLQSAPSTSTVQTQVTSLPQIVIPSICQTVQSCPQLLQTSSQSHAMPHIVTTSPQTLQSIPHLVQTSKPPSQQRFGIQPVQLGSSTTQLRRVMHHGQVAGQCAPHLVQISQPSLIQTVQTSTPQLQSTQAMSMASTVSFPASRQSDVEVAKATSPTKQSLVPVYMVPSSSASQLPVVISSATGVVLANSQAAPVVLRQMPKQDNKLSGDTSHETYVFRCDSSQPLLLSTSAIQQFLSGNSTVASTGHLSTATVVASSAPVYSVASVVDSAVVSDSSSLSINSTTVSNEIPVNTLSTISPSTVSQMYPSTAQTVLDSPASTISLAVSKAVTPTSSNVSPSLNVLPTGSPATLLALQQQQQLKRQELLKEGKMQEKMQEMQKIQQLRRLTQQQQLQPLSADLSPSLIASGSQSQLVTNSLLTSQLDSKKSPQKLSPQLQYHVTEPKELRQLLETSPAPLPTPLPPLFSTVVRRPSNSSDDLGTGLASPLIEEVKPKLEVGKQVANQDQNQEERKVQNSSIEVLSAQVVTVGTVSKSSTAKSSDVEDLSGGQIGDRLSFPEMQLPDSSSEQYTASSDKSSGTLGVEELFRPKTEQSILQSSTTKLLVSPITLPSSTIQEPKHAMLTPAKLSAVYPEKQQPIFSSENQPSTPSSGTSSFAFLPEKLPGTPQVTSQVEKHLELPTPALLPLKQTSTSSSEKLQPQNVRNIATSDSDKSLPKLSAPKGKKSPKIYALKTPVNFSTAKLSSKSAKPIHAASSSVKAMVFTHGGIEAFSSSSDAIVLSQTENQGEAVAVKEHMSNPLPSLKALECDQTGSLVATGAINDADTKSGEAACKGSTALPDVTPIVQCLQPQLPKLNPLTKFLQSQAVSSKNQQLPNTEAPPLAPVSGSKSLELSSLEPQLDDASPNLKGLQSGLPIHLHSEVKTLNSSEIRVYLPSSGNAEMDKFITSSNSKSSTSFQLASPTNASAPSLVLTSAEVSTSALSPNSVSPGKGRSSGLVTYSALKATSPKIQVSTQATLQYLTTAPLQVQTPVSAKAQAVLHQPQVLQSPGTSTLQLQATAPPALTVQLQPVSTNSESAPESDSSLTPPKSKRQRNRKRTRKSPEEESPTSNADIESKPKISSGAISDSELIPPKKSSKKRESSSYKLISPEIVSKHLSDTIMRVSIGADDPSLNFDEDSKPDVRDIEDVSCISENFEAPLVKDVFYEDQDEKIPVEVAVAALCGEDIEMATDLIEGNLQGDSKRRGSITLLPADPADNGEEFNFNFNKSVVQKASDERNITGTSQPLNSCNQSSFNAARDSSVISSIVSSAETESFSAVDIVSTGDKQEPDLVSGSKDEDPVSLKTTAKCKDSHTGSFSEYSRSLSGSEDLSMDKTSTSDIFPEPDILFETTLSPSFLGEIAQLSPTNSQDAVCASPEPGDKKRRFLLGKTGLSSKTQSTTPESFSEVVSKSGQDGVNVNKVDGLNQFNGGTIKGNVSLGDSFKCGLKQECSFLETSFGDQVPHILSTNEQHGVMAGSSGTMSAFFGTVKSSSGTADNCVGDVTIDEAPWEKEPLYVGQASDNEDEFWKKTLTSGVVIDLSQEEDTNSSSTPSDAVSKNVKQSGHNTTKSSVTPQLRSGGLKRKEEAVSSPTPKMSSEKRKKGNLEEDDGMTKYGSVLRSSAIKSSNLSRREGSRGGIPKEEPLAVVERRVSRRFAKPVTKYDEPQKKVKPSPKQLPKAIAHKKK